MTSLLFRMIPKRDGFLYHKWDSMVLNDSEFHKLPNCTDGIGWVLNVMLFLYLFEFHYNRL